MTATAVVTGSSGLLGRCLTSVLAGRGIAVRALRARFGAEAGESIVPIEVGPLAELLTEVSPTYVFHLAGTAKAASAAEYYQVNTLYAATMIDALAQAGLKSSLLVLVGSAAEYGPMPEAFLPAREDGPTRPADFYGASKLAQTHLGLVAAQKGQRVLVVRPSNIIGPKMSQHLAVGAFVQQLGEIARGENQPVLDVGDLTSRRDLIDVADVAEFTVRLAETPAATGRVVNVSTGRSVPMADVVQLLLDQFERSGHAQVRVHQREVPATAASSRVHFSCNRTLRELLGVIEYSPLEASLGRILTAELEQLR